MVSGQLSVVSGQWSVVSGQLLVVSGQLLVVSGQGFGHFTSSTDAWFYLRKGTEYKLKGQILYAIEAKHPSRIAAQMINLEPYRPVSNPPSISRDSFNCH